MSVQSLNQSRSSIQSVGLEPSQSQLQSQIPSYCTLPRHSIGQNAAGSAFHPVARSAPATPKTERPLPRATPKTQNQRSDVQVGRSMSQPSSPKSAPISSVYSVKRDTVTSGDPLVQALPARKSTVTSSGNSFVILLIMIPYIVISFRKFSLRIICFMYFINIALQLKSR